METNDYKLLIVVASVCVTVLRLFGLGNNIIFIVMLNYNMNIVELLRLICVAVAIYLDKHNITIS